MSPCKPVAENDDWLITPPMLFEAGKLYMLRTTVQGCGDLYITYGQGNTPEQQTNEIDHITATSVYAHGINNTIRNRETHYYYFRVSPCEPDAPLRVSPCEPVARIPRLQ